MLTASEIEVTITYVTFIQTPLHGQLSWGVVLDPVAMVSKVSGPQ